MRPGVVRHDQAADRLAHVRVELRDGVGQDAVGDGEHPREGLRLLPVPFPLGGAQTQADVPLGHPAGCPDERGVDPQAPGRGRWRGRGSRRASRGRRPGSCRGRGVGAADVPGGGVRLLGVPERHRQRGLQWPTRRRAGPSAYRLWTATPSPTSGWAICIRSPPPAEHGDALARDPAELRAGADARVTRTPGRGRAGRARSPAPAVSAARPSVRTRPSCVTRGGTLLPPLIEPERGGRSAPRREV